MSEGKRDKPSRTSAHWKKCFRLERVRISQVDQRVPHRFRKRRECPIGFWTFFVFADMPRKRDEAKWCKRLSFSGFILSPTGLRILTRFSNKYSLTSHLSRLIHSILVQPVQNLRPTWRALAFGLRLQQRRCCLNNISSSLFLLSPGGLVSGLAALIPGARLGGRCPIGASRRGGRLSGYRSLN